MSMTANLYTGMHVTYNIGTLFIIIIIKHFTAIIKYLKEHILAW